MKRVSFTLPWVPPALNVALRSHWSRRHQTMHTATALLLAAAGRRDPPEDGPVRVRIHLVRLGWARDDSPRWMDQQVFVLDLQADVKPHTEIEIERLPKKGRGQFLRAKREGTGERFQFERD